MENSKSILVLNSKGQGTVEYVLLLVVIASLTTFVLKLPIFQAWIGEDKSIYESLARNIEYTYRYGSNGRDDIYSNDYTDVNLDSYRSDVGKSRFFGPRSSYE